MRSRVPARASRRLRTWAALAASAVAPLAFAACNVVAGLDKFEEVACLNDCPKLGADSATVDAPLEAAPAVDAGLDTGAGPPVILFDSRRAWARWTVSDREAGTRALDSAGAVYDSVTGMTWELVPTWQPSLAAAEAHCASLTPPMLVPSRIELLTLLDFRGGSTPAIDPVFALDGGQDAGADATVAREATTYVALNGYVVDFATGIASHAAPPSPVAVRCVRVEPSFEATR